MADRTDRTFRRSIATGWKLSGALTHLEVLSAVYILILCASFLLETRGQRNLFYLTALPVFLLSLRKYDWNSLWASTIARVVFIYLLYYFASGLWSSGFAWTDLADLLRVTLLLSLFLLMTVRLGSFDERFLDRFAFWFAVVAGTSLLIVTAGLLTGLMPFSFRLGGFGIATHPVIGSTLYGVALLLCTYVLLPAAESWRARLIWLVIIFLCAGFMLLSGSRGPLLALAAALLAGLVLVDRRRSVVIIVLIAMVLTFGFLLDFRPIEMLYQRGQSGHFDIWRQALTATIEKPWFGYGSLTEVVFDSKHGTTRSPHNLLLANQFYGGLLATILLATLLVLTIREAILAGRQGKPVYLILLIFALTASLFDTRSLVQNLGREWITLWLPTGLLAAQESLRRRQLTSQARRQ